VLPGANGTTIRTGRSGQAALLAGAADCAELSAGSAAVASQAA
jgi:hypothetical protein